MQCQQYSYPCALVHIKATKRVAGGEAAYWCWKLEAESYITAGRQAEKEKEGQRQRETESQIDGDRESCCDILKQLPSWRKRFKVGFTVIHYRQQITAQMFGNDMDTSVP